MGEHGQGTIVPIETKTGRRYRVAVTMADGRRVWRRARTEREAERIRGKLVEARELDLDPSRQTLAAFLRSWLDGLRGARNARVRPRTLQHYELIVESHILKPDSPLAKLKLAQVTPGRIQAWIDADPAAPRTVHHHRAVLRRALNVAVRQRLLAYNPAALVELPDVEKDRSDPLDLDEVLALLEATGGRRLPPGVYGPTLPPDRLHALWRLALATGLRQGELLGLAWDDVVDDTITVRAQLQRLAPDAGGDRNGWARTPTKAARTVERIHVDPDTVEVLARHRTRQAGERAPAWDYFGLVFVTELGAPFHSKRVGNEFDAACSKAGIRRRRFHDLRHTHNRLLKDAGVTEDVRMARLGHNTTEMSRRYGGASSDADRAAAAALGAKLGRRAG